MKNRKIKVTQYALAEVIEALTTDTKHFADIIVTKEDGHLVVMFNPTIDECECLNELIKKVTPKEDKPGYPMRDYPMHGDPVLCDSDITTSAVEKLNTNVTVRQTFETLY